jgi:hypothetical protein
MISTSHVGRLLLVDWIWGHAQETMEDVKATQRVVWFELLNL